MGQTAWARSIDSARPGVAADFYAVKHGDVVFARNGGATAVFPGLFVAQGTDDEEAIIRSLTGGVYLGVAVDSNIRERDQGATTTEGYLENDVFGVAKDGRFYVITEEAVAKGDPVYVRHTAGAGGTQLGATRNDADTATADLVNAKFAETTTAAGYAIVELHMTQV